MVAAVVHEHDRARLREANRTGADDGYAGVLVIAGIDVPEDRLEMRSPRRRGDLGVDQPVRRTEETGCEAGGGANAVVRRRQLTVAGIARVVEGVVANLIAAGKDPAQQRFAIFDVPSLLEEGRAGVQAVEDVEDRRRLRRAGAVVEGERDDGA